MTMATMRAVLAAALVVACASAASATNVPFKIASITDGDMTVSRPKMYTVGTTPLGPGVDCTVTFEGQVKHAKKLTAGTMKYKIYESGVQHFVAEGSIPYFRCNNKGCDRSDGIALHLIDPTGVTTWYTAQVTLTLPAALKTGDFTLVVWGTDERHYPYDFSMSLEYKYATGVVADGSTWVAVEEGAWKPGKIEFNVTDGAFDMSTVTLESATGTWGPGTVAKVDFTGESLVRVSAGTLRWKIYEAGVKYFVGQGSAPFFQCTNKGCNTANGIALKLAKPSANATSFKLSTTFVMPKAQATGQFKVVFWGVDQVHYPYLFDSTIAYNFQPVSALDSSSGYKPADVSYTAENGNMSVTFFQVLTEDGKLAAGQEAQVQQLGVVLKRLSAGAVQWQIYEQGIRSFVQSGNADYFKCTNKGCDIMDPLALTLSASTVPATYMLSFQFAVPKPMATGEFTLVSWGVDQDHTPYDYTTLAHFTVPMQ